MTGLRVPGHTLVNEGRGISTWGCCSHLSYAEWGHGWCSCGKRSEHLPSDAARKRWHREHKQQIIDPKEKA